MNIDLKTAWPIVAALFLGAGGASSFFVTRGESDCKASLAGATARLDAAAEVVAACRSALDLCAPRPSPREAP